MPSAVGSRVGRSAGTAKVEVQRGNNLNVSYGKSLTHTALGIVYY